MSSAYLSLGTNIGNKIKNLQTALDEIDLRIGNVISISSLYENPPVGFDGDMFYNCCISIKTKLNPKSLLDELLKIEIKGGRSRDNKEGYKSRTIDLDILFYENQIINSEGLKVPHPKLHERDFVIKPLTEIAQSKIHPIIKKTVLEIGKKFKNFDSLKKINEKLNNPIFNCLKKFNNIAVEGNIGVGKTSLSKKLSNDLNKNLILENFQKNPFLEKFYNNPNDYALNLELTFLVDRCRELNHYKNQFDLFKSGIVLDYHIKKSLIFAGITLNEVDYNLYRNIYFFMTKDLLKPDLIIYLMQNSKNLISNIKKRGRFFEKQIDALYLNKISEAYKKTFNSMSNQNVVFVDISELDFVEKDSNYSSLIEIIKNKLV